MILKVCRYPVETLKSNVELSEFLYEYHYTLFKSFCKGYLEKEKKKIIASHIKLKTKMKVRNLLLASLAVAAMTACSNENDEFVNNGNQTGEKNAIMEFGIAFPSLTRATETGLSAEQDFQSATVIISYESGGKDVTIIPRIKFEESTPNVLYTKDKITVQPGNVYLRQRVLTVR